jgi:hypothetical protein
MTGKDFREALRWSLVVAVIVALWCGVLSVRTARGAIAGEPSTGNIQQGFSAPENLRPVWVIVVYEVSEQKLIGITEFVFASYQECQDGAADAERKLDLHLRPVCFLRWMRGESESGL